MNARHGSGQSADHGARNARNARFGIGHCQHQVHRGVPRQPHRFSSGSMPENASPEPRLQPRLGGQHIKRIISVQVLHAGPLSESWLERSRRVWHLIVG